MVRISLHLLCCLYSAAACAAQTGKTEISAFPALSALHDDQQRRADQLDSAAQRPGPEMPRGKTQKQLKAETALATVAALIGSLNSTSPNVVIGTRTPFDENNLFATAPDESWILPKLSLPSAGSLLAALAPSVVPSGGPMGQADWLLMGLGWVVNWNNIAVPEASEEEDAPLSGWMPTVPATNEH